MALTVTGTGCSPRQACWPCSAYKNGQSAEHWGAQGTCAPKTAKSSYLRTYPVVRWVLATIASKHQDGGEHLLHWAPNQNSNWCLSTSVLCYFGQSDAEVVWFGLGSLIHRICRLLIPYDLPHCGFENIILHVRVCLEQSVTKAE